VYPTLQNGIGVAGVAMNALFLHLLCESFVVQDQIALYRVSGLMLLDFIFATHPVTFFSRKFQTRGTCSDIGRDARFRGWQRFARCFEPLDLCRAYCVSSEGIRTGKGSGISEGTALASRR
jgi:hypothetical protein